MSNDELIAQARELCEKRVGEYQVTLDSFQEKSGEGYERTLITHNAWTTHLAEMEELIKTIESMNGKGIFSPIYFEELVTKAKRLLGVRNK